MRFALSIPLGLIAFLLTVTVNELIYISILHRSWLGDGVNLFLMAAISNFLAGSAYIFVVQAVAPKYKKIVSGIALSIWPIAIVFYTSLYFIFPAAFKNTVSWVQFVALTAALISSFIVLINIEEN